MAKPKQSDMKAEPIAWERQEIPDAAVEAAHTVTGYVPAMLKVALCAALPAIRADLRERLLSDKVLDEAADQLNELSGGPDSWDAFTLAKTAIAAALDPIGLGEERADTLSPNPRDTLTDEERAEHEASLRDIADKRERADRG